MHQSLTSRSLALAAALAFSTLAIAPAAHAAPVDPAGAAVTNSVHGPGSATRHLLSTTAGEHLLETPYQQQTTSWWCGPTAVAMALGVLGVTDVTQASLAAEMGTNPNTGTGVDGAVNALRNHSGAPYEASFLPVGSGSSGAQTLWNSIVEDINGGYAVVTAIGAPPHTYPYYDNPTMIHHFFVVDGYDTDYTTVHISDPANFNGNSGYWITLADLAYLVEDHYYFW